MIIAQIPKNKKQNQYWLHGKYFVILYSYSLVSDLRWFNLSTLIEVISFTSKYLQNNNIQLYRIIYGKFDVILTVPKSRQECFWVSRLILPVYSGLPFLCTCTLEDSSCRQDNPDRCRLKSSMRKTNQLFNFSFRSFLSTKSLLCFKIL